jgi:hypothetical protein
LSTWLLKVIVASDVIRHKEILGNGYNGLLFADGNSCDLDEKLNFVINNSGNTQLKNMQHNAWRDFSEILLGRTRIEAP